MTKRFSRGPTKIQMRQNLKDVLREFETTAQDIIDVSGWVRVIEVNMDENVIEQYRISVSIDSPESGEALAALYQYGMAHIQGGWLYLNGAVEEMLEDMA